MLARDPGGKTGTHFSWSRAVDRAVQGVPPQGWTARSSPGPLRPAAGRCFWLSGVDSL